MTRSIAAPAWLRLGLSLIGLFLAPAVAADSLAEVLQRLDRYPHSVTVDASSEEVRDYEIGLGAIQKIGGAWQFKHSERLSGTVTRHTWQIVDGFESAAILEEVVASVSEMPGSELLFDCTGRSCGPAVQWANRVFHQRVLYGRDADQQYRVYRLPGPPEQRLLLYSAVRPPDRQYLHAESLGVAP